MRLLPQDVCAESKKQLFTGARPWATKAEKNLKKKLRNNTPTKSSTRSRKSSKNNQRKKSEAEIQATPAQPFAVVRTNEATSDGRLINDH